MNPPRCTKNPRISFGLYVREDAKKSIAKVTSWAATLTTRSLRSPDGCNTSISPATDVAINTMDEGADKDRPDEPGHGC